MNQHFIRSIFRGGGQTCSCHKKWDDRNHDESVIDQDQISQFFYDFDSKCSIINDLSKSIQSQESQDSILKLMRQILLQSQLINQASQNYRQAREYIKQTLQNLETLLDTITNTIISQHFITLQILKICNQISRLIFQYYANNQIIPLDQERQKSILSILNQIQELLTQGGEQVYYNSIFYELFVIKTCIEICPNDSDEGREVFINIIVDIKAALDEFNTDLLVSLAKGGLYLYNEIKKRKQRKVFKILFYLEEFKYKFIENIQQGQGVNKIMKQLVNNYDILIKNSNDWLIKCSWIKIISELIIYKPIISLKLFQIIKNKHQLETDWENLIQQRIITVINDKQNIGIIQKNDENSNTNRILQQQIIKFQIIQNYIINGEKNVPKLEQMKEFSNQKQDLSTQQSNLFIEQLQNLPIGQFIQQLKLYSLSIIKYTELVKDFIEEIVNGNSNKQYLLQQIEQIICESEEMSKIWSELLLHNDIICDLMDPKINNFNDLQQSNTSFNLLINQAIQYFQIAGTLDYNFVNVIDEYTSLKNKLLINYNINVQLQEKLNITQNNQYDKVDKLLLKLQETKKKNEFIITIGDLIYYIKKISIINQQIQQIRSTFILYNLKFLNIRSILIVYDPFDQNNLAQILDQHFKKEFFQQMFYNYSGIQTLIFIYEQIDNNRDVLVSKVFDLTLQLQTGINLKTLQQNSRIQEQLQNQEIIQRKLIQYYTQINTLDQKIYYLNLLEHSHSSMLGQTKILISDIAVQLNKIEEYTKNQNQENTQTNLRDLINKNFNQSTHDVQNNKFIEQIIDRLELYKQLSKTPSYLLDANINDDIKLLQLIIENSQQKYQNIQAQEILKMIEMQNVRFNQNNQVQVIQNLNQAVIQIYKDYLIKINNIIQDLDLFKHQEKLNTLKQEIPNITNYIRFRVLQQQQLDQQKLSKYDEIVVAFYQTFSVNLEQVQVVLQQELLILQKQVQKMSLDELKAIIPSYKELSNYAMDNYKKLSVKQTALQFINDQLTGEVWRVKEYFYFNCLAFHQFLDENNQKIVGQLLLIARFRETDYRIINTLKGKDQIQQMNALINNQWEDTQNQVINELQLRLNELQAIQLQLQSEERKDIRDQLLQSHKNLEQQLEQQIKNVNEIGDVLGVTIYFLKDIKRDLGLIQNKLDNIIQSIDQIGQDIKFLRGKTPQQILEIRMQSVLLEKVYQDAQSVYVQMKTQEFNFLTNLETEQKTPLFNIDNEKNGEIDEFLIEKEKSSLLIHGAAGSGKSLTARKIEEYLWLQYQKQCQNKLWQDINCTPPQIPIFIQLPTLKDPKFNAIEETLQSQMYRFDQKQTDLLKDAAQKNQIGLIFIMDSYDELPQQYQGINLILSNKIHLWKPDNQLQIPKVITTSRSEAFTTNDYRAWFWENDTYGFQWLKEIRLLPFDDLQSQDFLQQFSLLKLKISINDLLQVIARNQDKYQLFKDTSDVYEQFQQHLQLNLKQDNKSTLLDQNQLQKLIKIIQENKNVTFINQEQEIAFSKIILGLWHQNLYNDAIQQMNLQPLLETPYMLNIVVEVLPQMNNQVSQPSDIKQYFIKNHYNLTKKFLDSTIKIYDSNQITEQKDSYKAEEVKKFKSYINGQQLSLDSSNIWELLIKNQFFNNWNVQSSLEHTVEELDKLQIINHDIFPIQKKDEQIIVYKSLKSHQLTLFDFFNLFIEQFIENQRQKLIYQSDILDQNQFEQDIYKYATRLSILMFQRQETIIERKTQGILFRQQNADPYSQFFEVADQYGSYRKQIRKCIPLSQKGNFYQFRHKSIQEFLLSKETFGFFENAYEIIEILNELLGNLRKSNRQLDLLLLQQDNNLNRESRSQDEQRKYDTLVEILKIIETSFLNQINLQDTFNLGALKFIKTKFSQETDLYKILYTFTLLSSVNRQFIRFSSNCLIIILQVSLFQNGQDFSKIILSDISIDGAIFENCDLRFSKFDKVSIKGLNLNCSDISNCEWNMLFSNDLPVIKIGNESTRCQSELSPNRQFILSYSQSVQGKDNITIWNSNSAERVVELKGHKEVNQACFSHNSQVLLSYGGDLFLRLWEVKSFTQIKEHKLGFHLKGLIFNEQDNKIAYYDLDNLYIINSLDKFNDKVTIKLKARIYALKFYDQFIISLNKEQEKVNKEQEKVQIHLQQWNQISGEMIQEQNYPLSQGYKPIFGQFHKDLLFIVYNNNIIEKWDISIKFQPKGSPFIGHNSQINCIDVSQDGKYLVSGGADSLIIIYDVKSCNKISTLIGHRTEVNSVQFSSDVKLITTCSEDGEIRFWDAKVNKQLENSSLIKTVKFSQDSNQLIYLNNRGQIIFNDLATGLQTNEKITDEKNPISCMSLSYDGRQLLYSTGLATKIYDLRLMKQLGSTNETTDADKVTNLGYSQDGSKVFLAFENNIILKDPKNYIILYDPKNWKQLKQYPNTSKEPQLSQNNKYIMYLQTLPKSFQIILLDFQTLKEQVLPINMNIHKFDIGNDGKMLVAMPLEAWQKFILIWDLNLKSEPIQQKIDLKSELASIKISPNCQYIIVGTQDGNVSTINPQQGYLVHLIASFSRPVEEIIISPNQSYFTGITKDPILYVLKIEDKDWRSFIKFSIPQNLGSQTLMQDLKFENSTIKSHLGYNLKALFQKKKENQRQ